MNIQLDNVLGFLNRRSQSNADDRNTWSSLLARYEHVATAMAACEAEVPQINNPRCRKMVKSFAKDLPGFMLEFQDRKMTKTMTKTLPIKI